MRDDQAGEEQRRNAFLRQFAVDREQSGVQSLEAYLQMFPGDCSALEREYRELVDAGGPREDSASDDDSIGPYRLLKEIGRGGQGAVWLAVDTRLGRQVALKILSRFWPPDREVMQRFLREASVSSRLEHPHICPVYDTGTHRGVPFIVMRFVEGRTLAEWIGEARGRGEPLGTTLLDATDDSTSSGSTPSRRRPLPAVLELIEKTARALHAAHELDILHRDIKPGNLIVSPECEPVILDFGLARSLTEHETALTGTGELLGTPAYMAPEQIAGRPVDRRTDVYALGVTLHEALTLERPFNASTREDLYRRILEGDAPDLRRAHPTVPRDVATVVAKALERDPARRYPTALDLADDLGRVLAGEPIRARPISPFGRTWRWIRREPAQAAALAFAFALIGLGGFLVARWPEMRRAQQLERVERAETMVEYGFGLLWDGNLDLARRSFEQALALDPESGEAIAGLALAGLRRDKAEESRSFVERHGVVFDRYPSLRWAWDEALREGGEVDDADLSARLADENDALALYFRGQRALQRGRAGELAAFAEAAELFAQAIFNSPETRRIFYYSYARAAGYCGDPVHAQRAERALARLWPERRTAHFYRGFALGGPGEDHVRADPAGAIAAYRRAIDLSPGYVQAMRNLASLLGERGDRDEALAMLRDVIAMGPSAKDHYDLGNLLESENRLDEAVAAYRAALEVDPTFPEAHCNLGVALYQKGDLDRAVEELRRAVDLRQEYPIAHNMLGVGLLARGDPEAAIAAIKTALSQDPDYGKAWQNLGFVLYQNGDKRAAAEHWTRAAELLPEQPGAFQNLALVRIDLGEGKAALRALDRLRELHPESKVLETLTREAEALGKDR